MNKKTKLALLIGAVAAVVSAIILVIAFWDKLLALCPCCKDDELDYELPEEEPVEELPAEEEAPVLSEEEKADYADVEEV